MSGPSKVAEPFYVLFMLFYVIFIARRFAMISPRLKVEILLRH